MKTTQQPRTKGSPSTRRRRKTISSSATTEEDLNPLFPGPAFQVQYPEYPADTTPLNICFPFVAGCPFKQKKKKILKKERIYIVYNHDDRYTTRSRTIPAIYRSVLIRRSSPEESCKKQLCITTAPFFFYIFLSFFFFSSNTPVRFTTIQSFFSVELAFGEGSSFVRSYLVSTVFLERYI